MSSSPDPRDFLDLDAELSEEDRAMRDAVRAFAQDQLLPNVAEWYESGALPAAELAKGFGQLGLLGMHLEGYGCAGTSAVAYGIACRELEAVDSGLRSFVSVQGSLAMYAIHKWGTEEHKQEWLPRMAAGDALGCFGLTEPDAGSDPGSMRARAVRDGSDWLLSGTKMWITNGTVADVAVVWAQTDEGVRGFVVPTDTPGFTANEVKHKLSLRASLTAELVLDGVRLPESAAFPDVRGLRGPLSCLNEARYGILFGVVGAARSCYESALEYTLSREQFGKPLAGFQLTQRKLADLVVEVNRAGLIALRIGRLKDAGTLHHNHVSFGKLANVRSALEVARTARAMLGANGISLEYPVMRHMSNLETVLTYEGTEEMHALSIGQSVTGLAAFR
ncbi:acyl-CoA dehydrogenase family protein [Amycolatopsis sp. cmx-11-12]|uniref:acyl-CoA dehydrogenase family protein n=1 Tax=Amycolatopsis sp. cmx-11-12 TaxID=2785795 RepID=UPI00391818CC